MKEAVRRLAPVALAIGALVLGGCGGGGASPAATETATSTSTATTATVPPHKLKAKPKVQAKAPEPKPQSAPTDPAPLPNQGTATIAPGVPTVKGGDNSIQAYGLEAESAQRVAAASAANAYLEDQARGHWARACSGLSAKARASLGESIEETQASSPSQGCAAAMAALLAKMPQDQLRSAAQIHVLSFRVKEDQAFLIYRDGEGTPENLPMSREGGEWKVGSLLGIELVL